MIQLKKKNEIWLKIAWNHAHNSIFISKIKNIKHTFMATKGWKHLATLGFFQDGGFSDLFSNISRLQISYHICNPLIFLDFLMISIKFGHFFTIRKKVLVRRWLYIKVYWPTNFFNSFYLLSRDGAEVAKNLLIEKAKFSLKNWTYF